MTATGLVKIPRRQIVRYRDGSACEWMSYVNMPDPLSPRSQPRTGCGPGGPGAIIEWKLPAVLGKRLSRRGAPAGYGWRGISEDGRLFTDGRWRHVHVRTQGRSGRGWAVLIEFRTDDANQRWVMHDPAKFRDPPGDM